MTQKELADSFGALHQKGNPLILFNIWDAGSARTVQEAGAKALATGSWSVAAAHGYQDGEHLPLELVIANLQRIVASVRVPVSLDFESGYARTPERLSQNIAAVISAGAVGINFEDKRAEDGELYSVEEQCGRIHAIYSQARAQDIPLFINARSDVFLKAKPPEHSDQHVEAALKRCEAYAKVGASGFFPVGVRKPELIESICKRSELPVNILMYPEMNIGVQELARMGAARISHGPFPYRMMIEYLKDAGRPLYKTV